MLEQQTGSKEPSFSCLPEWPQGAGSTPDQDGLEPGAGSLGHRPAHLSQMRHRDSAPQHLCYGITSINLQVQELPLPADGGRRGRRMGQAVPSGAWGIYLRGGFCLSHSPEIGSFWEQVGLLAQRMINVNCIIKRFFFFLIHLFISKYNYLKQTLEKQKCLIEK